MVCKPNECTVGALVICGTNTLMASCDNAGNAMSTASLMNVAPGGMVTLDLPAKDTG